MSTGSSGADNLKRPLHREETPDHNLGAHSKAAKWQMNKVLTQLTKKLEKNNYAYKNINYDEEIRVLKVYPDLPGEPLVCCLVPCPLLETTSKLIQKPSTYIDFDALSYYWGEDQPQHDVYILEDDEAYKTWKAKDKSKRLLMLFGRILIRQNLGDALEQLRSPSEPVYLWADALCINQPNVTERTAQVARMHDVYSQARKVYVWLELDKAKAEENKKAFQFLRKILDLKELEDVVKRLERKKENSGWEEDRQNCMFTIDLMTKVKWFSRRWVIQELALAAKPYVRRGDQELAWSEFADAIALFTTKYDQIRRAAFTRRAPKDYNTSRNSTDHQISSLDARALGANALVTTTSNLFRKSSEGLILQRLLTLELLVSSMLLAFEASDPKDTVFAVLQIAKDIPGNGQTAHRSKISIRPSGAIGMITDLFVPLAGTFVWKFALHTTATTIPGGLGSQIPLTDTSVAISARDGMVIFIECCKLALSTLSAWLMWRKLLDIMEKLILYIFTGSSGVKPIDKRIEANYRKCLLDVCADFIEYCIETSNSLDILCRHWAPEPKPGTNSTIVDLPSWILRSTGHAFGGYQQSLSRVNGDSFVGGYETGVQYTASGNTSPSFKFEKNKEVREIHVEEVKQHPGTYSGQATGETKEFPARFNGTLNVEGFQLGAIEQTAPIIGELISRAALELCGWSEKEGASDPDQAWRILVANRGPDGRNPPNWYRRAFQASLEWYKEQKGSGVINTQRLMDLKGTPEGKVKFLDRVQQVTYNRNIIRTWPSEGRETGFIGVAPQKSQANDIVCILFGCSVPVVLRRHRGKDTFEFIGECYVHGVMDGEAMDQPIRTKEEWFKLI